ncbi:hypothetical protein D0784_11385 [Vibrio campbellii]|nr:hypothetical protein BWP24_04860 [Vibrio campbellii]AYO09960.1 hypothetical protein D0784_11385 [Vibrio campbellii]
MQQNGFINIDKNPAIVERRDSEVSPFLLGDDQNLYLKCARSKVRLQHMDFTEKLRLREKAIEDLYFAEVDRKLIEALHEKQNQPVLPVPSERDEDDISQ